MKKLVLYFLLLMAIPATAQSGLFGSHSDHHAPPSSPPPPPAEHHHPGPMIKTGKPAAPANRNEGKGMNTRDYEDAVRIINNENFDESRLNMAKRIISGNPMNSRQIAKICRLFAFEANRLEFAKYAYKHCVDPNKYFLLDEVFTFESSKKELDEFIQK